MKSSRAIRRDLANLSLNWKGNYQQNRRYRMLREELITAEEREAREAAEPKPEFKGPHLLADRSWMRA